MLSFKTQTIFFWILSLILMASLAIYQRLTGPTHPKNGSVLINGNRINYSLLRSWGGKEDAKIEIRINDNYLTGTLTYRRYKSFDNWTTVPLQQDYGMLIASIPNQPPAGKVMYYITLSDGKREYKLVDEPVIIRFKGDVPIYFMIPHIIIMFLAMVFSTRTFFEAVFKRNNVYKLAVWTLVLLLIGGVILGPIIQYYAFGALWTGWPFGHDLTDNKTLVSLIFWFIAVILTKKNPTNTKWAIIASIVMIAVYLIPHSVLGSELDFTKMKQQ
ncbi:MAG: hypothetical protein ACUVQ1_00355 [Candidatus Kapaibacteriales bacterium]